MANKNEATLSNKGDMTSFTFGNYNIRFRTPSRLKRYTDVKEWDNGYIVVMADYDGIGITEEYDFSQLLPAVARDIKKIIQEKKLCFKEKNKQKSN